MPIYEYRCRKCGEFEVSQKITDAPLKKCPTCRSKVTKLISHTSFQLKGSGWYVTDYGRSGKAGQEGAPEAKADSTSAEPKSEAKPSSSKKTTGKGKEKAAA